MKQVNKEYQKAYQKEYRKRPYVKAKQKEYRRLYLTEHRIANRRWQEKNKEKKRELDKKYYKKNREKKLKYGRKRYSDNKERYRIYNKINYKERKGILKRNSFCEKCGSNQNLIKHHPDYSKPFEFITLCKNCHNKIHYLICPQKKKSFLTRRREGWTSL